jgi:photosystem II stability/assembly factor-like uncharacterized protein
MIQGTGYSLSQLYIDPLLGTNLYAGFQGVWFGSSSGGARWNALPFMQCDALTFDLKNAQTIYCSSGANFNTNHDAGSTWQEISSWQNQTEVNVITTAPENPQLIWAGGSGLYISDNGGKSWMDRSNSIGRDYLQLRLESAKPTMYIETLDGQVFSSTDHGNTWKLSGDNVGNPMYNKVGGAMYRVQGATIFSSHDGGVTWKNCADTGGVVPHETRPAVDPRDGNHIFLATSNGVLASRDGCQSWERQNQGLSSLSVNSVALDANHPDTVYAGTDDGAFVSMDGGNHWGEINDGLLGATVVYSIAVDESSTVYATTPSGIFKLGAK